jgi:hypothetical protein
MFRASPVSYAACGVTTLLALTPVVTSWQSGWDFDDETISQTDGHLQLAIDEQDVGEVAADAELQVCFVVANSGSERLLLRQARALDDRANHDPYPLYTVSPGRTIAIMARLNSNELGERGRKHIRFQTSDAACPELWLTVRGSAVLAGPPGRFYR